MVDYRSVFYQLLNEIREISQRAQSPEKKTALTHLIEAMDEMNFTHVKDVLKFSLEIKKSNTLDTHTSLAIRKKLQTMLIHAFEEEHRTLLGLENETKKFAGLCQLKTDVQALNNAPIYQLKAPCQVLYLTVSDDYERIKLARHIFLKQQKEEQALMAMEDHPLPCKLASPVVDVSPVVEAKVSRVSETVLNIAAASGSFLYQGAVNSVYFLGGFLPKQLMDLPPIHLRDETALLHEEVELTDAPRDGLVVDDFADLRETLGSSLDEEPTEIVTSSLLESCRDAFEGAPLALRTQDEQGGEDASDVSTEDHVLAYIEAMGEDSFEDAPYVLKTQDKLGTEVLSRSCASVVCSEDQALVSSEAMDKVATSTPVLKLASQVNAKPPEPSLIDTYKDSFDNVLYQMREFKDNRIVTLHTQLELFREPLFSKSTYHLVLPLIRECLKTAEKEFKHETGILRYIQPLLDGLRWLVSQVVELFSSGLAKKIAKPHQPGAQVFFEQQLRPTFFGDHMTHKKGLLSEISAFYGPAQ